MPPDRWFAVGTADASADDAGGRAADAALIHDGAKLLIVFCSPTENLPDLIGQIRSRSGDVPHDRLHDGRRDREVRPARRQRRRRRSRRGRLRHRHRGRGRGVGGSSRCRRRRRLPLPALTRRPSPPRRAAAHRWPGQRPGRDHPRRVFGRRRRGPDGRRLRGRRAEDDKDISVPRRPRADRLRDRGRHRFHRPAGDRRAARLACGGRANARDRQQPEPGRQPRQPAGP